jgi:hypothetical protein
MAVTCRALALKDVRLRHCKILLRPALARSHATHAPRKPPRQPTLPTSSSHRRCRGEEKADRSASLSKGAATYPVADIFHSPLTRCTRPSTSSQRICQPPEPHLFSSFTTTVATFLPSIHISHNPSRLRIYLTKTSSMVVLRDN